MTSRVMIGGVAAAAVIAGTTGAVALASPSSAPTPKPTASSAIAVDPTLVRVAAELGVSTDRLLQALPKVKVAATADGSLTGDAAARALAADLGVSVARAQRALQEFAGAGSPGSGAKSATALPPTRDSMRWRPRSTCPPPGPPRCSTRSTGWPIRVTASTRPARHSQR